MAGICCFVQPNPSLHLKRIHGIKCCSSTPEKENDSTRYTSKTTAPQLLKFAVNGVTELLRLFSSFDKDRLDREFSLLKYMLKIVHLKIQLLDFKNIEKGFDSEKDYVLATWKLRTYLKLPWRPLISIDGSTVYELNDEFKIVRHAESWNVSALEAIAQIFTPSGRN